METDERIAALIPTRAPCACSNGSSIGDDSSVVLATRRIAAGPSAGDPSGLRAIHLCEYGAQAMPCTEDLRPARAASLQDRLLVSLRDVMLGCDFIQDLAGELLVEARRLHDNGAAWQYEFRVTIAGRLLAEGRATVSVASHA